MADSLEKHTIIVVERTLDLGNISSNTRSTIPVKFDRGVSNFRWFLVCVALYAGALLYGLDTTIAADVQGVVLESLGEIDKLAWIGIGFPMGSVSVILLWGALLGAFDLKILFLAGVLIFEIGSAICVVAGVGGAGMYLGALIYLTKFTSPKERPLYNALIGFCWGTGCILGPVIGGGLSVSKATWRWAFYINLPLAALLSPVYIFIFPTHQPKPNVAIRSKIAQIDWVGALLNAGTFTVLQIIVSFSGSTYAWNSPTSIALWTLLALFIAAWVVQSAFCIFTSPQNRLFPVQFLRSRSMLLLYFCTAASTTGLAIGVFYIPIFFQFTKGDDAIQAAIRLLPFICICIFSILGVGAIMPLIGLYQPFYIGAGIFMTVGGALMYTVTSTTSVSTIYGFEVLIAIGVGISMQNAYSVVIAKVKPEEIQAAVGFINVAQIGSVAIALSIAASIYQNVGLQKLQAALAAYHLTQDQLRGALGGAFSILPPGIDPKIIESGTNAIVETIALEYLLVVAAGGLCLVSGLGMKWERLTLELTAGG